MAWMREVHKAKQVVLADMFRKYNRDEDKDDEGNKGRGGKKKKSPEGKKALMPLQKKCGFE